MDCLGFFAWFGSGVLIVPLLGWLKGLPRVGAVIEEIAWLAAPLLALILPKLAAIGTGYCDAIDAKLWALIYAALAYLVSQIVYYINKKYVKVGRE